jgi:AcrR family transcriptional regulator
MAQKSERSAATDARIIRSRDALRRALLKLLGSKSFEEITVREIVAEAGIGYTTFFRHHTTKEELLNHVAADEIDRLVALTVPILLAADTRAACTLLCGYVDQNRGLWSALLAGGAAGALRAEFIEEARRVTKSWPQIQAWVPAEIGTRITVSSTLELLTWWLSQKKPLPVAQVAEILDRLVIAPTVGQK